MKQIYILLILHFAVKMKDSMHSSDETYLVTGLTQNKVSQYFNKKCAMPRTSQIALAQHVMKSMNIHGETYIWLDKLNTASLNNTDVKKLIRYINANGKLASPRGRTDAMARHILRIYKSLH